MESNPPLGRFCGAAEGGRFQERRAGGGGPAGGEGAGGGGELRAYSPGAFVASGEGCTVETCVRSS